MINIRKLACGVLYAAIALATHSMSAQEAPPTQAMQPPSAAFPPERNVDTEVSIMTKRYGLSDDQAAKVRAILKDEQQKTEALLKDDSLSRRDLFTKMKSLREDETTRVSGVLTPDQRTKYQSDVEQIKHQLSQPPSGFPAPPPGLQGGGPPTS